MKSPTPIALCLALVMSTSCSAAKESPTAPSPSSARGAVYVLADASIGARFPLRIINDAQEFNRVNSATTFSGGTCTNTATPSTGIAAIFTETGSDTLQILSAVDNSYWDVPVTVVPGVCSVVRLTCQNGVCGDRSFQSFGYVTTESSRTLQVCVRDYECQDGDRVSVTFSGQGGNAIVFADQELTTADACRTIAVPKSGLYQFALRALNGTGFKGACSFEDVNTGELKLIGTGAAVRWSVQGGTATVSPGYVRVP